MQNLRLKHGYAAIGRMADDEVPIA